MGERLPPDIDGLIGELISARSTETGTAPETLAREALLKGLLWSAAERTAYADRVRSAIMDRLGGEPLEDSTQLVRDLRGSS